VATLNTPTPAALYRVFPPTDARRLTRTLEFHSTPTQGSWRHLAEGEFAVLASQCVAGRLPTLETVQKEITAWHAQRNPHQATIHWQCDPDVARGTLKRLYPSVGPSDHPLGPESAEPGKTFAAVH